MNTLIEDLKENDLRNVERVWIRKPASLILFSFSYPIVLLSSVGINIVLSTVDWTHLFLKCWKGKNN